MKEIILLNTEPIKYEPIYLFRFLNRHIEKDVTRFVYKLINAGILTNNNPMFKI